MAKFQNFPRNFPGLWSFHNVLVYGKVVTAPPSQTHKYLLPSVLPSFDTLKADQSIKSILGGQQTQNSRIFPGSYKNNLRFSRNPRHWMKNSKIKGIPDLQRKIPKFKEFQVFKEKFQNSRSYRFSKKNSKNSRNYRFSKKNLTIQGIAGFLGAVRTPSLRTTKRILYHLKNHGCICNITRGSNGISLEKYFIAVLTF